MVGRIILLSFGFCWAVLCVDDPYPDRIVSTDGRPVEWNSAWPTDARVEFFGSKPLSLTLRFFLNPFNESLHLGKWKLIHVCFRYRDPELFQCEKLNGDQKSKRMVIGNASALIVSNSSLGANVTFDKVPAEQELPIMFIQFKWDTTQGSVWSNRLHILDFRKNHPKETWRPKVKPTLYKNAASHLKCLERPLGIDEKLSLTKNLLWRQPTVGVDFKWYLCSGRTLSKCNASRELITELEEFSRWPMQVQSDGQLYFPFIPDHIVGKFLNKNLICDLNGEVVAFYAAGVNIVSRRALKEISDKITEKITYPLAMVRPKGEEAVILYDSFKYELQLPCLFNTTTTASVSWTYNKTVPLPAGKEDTVRKVRVSADGRSITFRGRFNKLTEGFYACHVTSKGRTVSGSYNISFRGPPRPSSSLSSVALISDNGSAEVSCAYEQPERLNTKLFVLGSTIDLESKAGVADSMSRINRMYEIKPTLNISVDKVPPKSGEPLRFTEQYNRSTLKNMSSSHYVTCVGMQPPFFTRKFVTVKYVEPIVELTAITRSCEFFCNVTNRTPFEEAGAIVHIAWTIDGSAIGGNTRVLNLCYNLLNLRFRNKAVRCDVKLSESHSGRFLFSRRSKERHYKDEMLLLILCIIGSLCLLLSIVVIIVCVSKRRRKRNNLQTHIDNESEKFI